MIITTIERKNPMKIFIATDSRSRLTIPENIRRKSGIKPSTLFSMTLNDDNSIVLKPVKICDNCITDSHPSLADLIKHYPEAERNKAFAALSIDYAKRCGGESDA